MAKHGKKYRAVKSKAPTVPQELADAIKFVQENKLSKFDETMELGIRLGVDPEKSDQTVRGTVSLPHGTGKKVRVIVFAEGAAADAAKAAGADVVGKDDLIAKVHGGWTDFDVAISTTEAMKDVRKLGKVLGPRGLMPNPKTGTVTDDPAGVVKQSKAGRVEFRMDRHGNVNVPFGKISFPLQNLVENAKTIIAAVRAERPASVKGIFMKRCAVTSTMGVGVKVAVKEE